MQRELLLLGPTASAARTWKAALADFHLLAEALFLGDCALLYLSRRRVLLGVGLTLLVLASALAVALDSVGALPGGERLSGLGAITEGGWHHCEGDASRGSTTLRGWSG